MQAITIHAHIGQDGLLKLDLPVGVVDQDIEVVVVFQSLAKTSSTNHNTNGQRADIFALLDSIEADDLIERPDQGTLKIREPIE